MVSNSFVLSFWEDRSGHRLDYKFGWRSEETPFGDILVTYPAGRHGDMVHTEVTGSKIPATRFAGHAYGRMPSLTFANFSAGGDRVGLKRNRWGQTNRGRALHLQLKSSRYTYAAASRDGRKHVLRREGAEVTLARRGRGKRQETLVGFSGDVGPLDISVAVTFTGVDTRNLTRRGAVRSSFSRVFDWLDW